MARVVKELTPKASFDKVKSLIKEKKRLKAKDFAEGNLLFYSYDAKDKENTYDKTPLVLVLKRGRSHTLGLNFHWIPFRMRINLIKYIIGINERNIRNGKPIQFSFDDLKPMLKGLGYSPCIRLYINKRISSNGVVIPPDRLLEVARLRTETFTNGRYSAEQLFRKARQRAKKR